jgi:CubicO group peptidase (beta-lactamase class C family)
MSEVKIPKKIPSGIINILENAIVSLMMESKVPGASFAVVAGDKVIYAKAFGARNLEKNIPTTVDTLYGFGSCTKSYTALAIMQLVQEGKLDVNDPVSKYLDFKLGKRSIPITIHHLLTHSAGIPNIGIADELISRGLGLEHTFIPFSSWNDFYLHVNGAAQWITPEPGQRFAYSNGSYTMLGEIIAKVSDMKYEDYIKKRILEPLNMNNSIFTQEEFEKFPDVMTPYYGRMKKGKIVEVFPTSHPFDKFVYAAGGLISSVMDQVNYLKVYLNEGKFEGQEILEKSLLDEMEKIHFKTELVQNTVGGFEKEGYGYGWVIIEDFFGEKFLAHPGGTQSSTAFLGILPSRKIGIACASNTGSGANLMAMVPILLSTFFVGKDPMNDLKFVQIEQKLAKLTGVYETYKGFLRVKVVKAGAFLYIEPEYGLLAYDQGIPLIPDKEDVEDYKFYTLSGAGGRMSIEFIVNEKGNIDFLMERNRFRKVRELPK